MEAYELDETFLRGHAQVWLLMYGFVNTMALKCAVDLHIADIIHSHGSPITLSHIASGISDSPSLNIQYLGRVMRYLVHKKIFTAHLSSDGGDTRYWLTPASRCILRDSNLTLVPMVSFVCWEHSLRDLSHCVKSGESVCKNAFGSEIWDLASKNPKFNDVFNDAMASTTKIATAGFLSAYRDELGCIGSLVDVGGGTGGVITEIVKSHPHIKGINFDLPHVIAKAPVYDGVEHVGGDMFEAIPKADAVIAKWIFHNWNDEDCVKLLKNCRKSIPENGGKLIILEAVVEPEKNGGDSIEEDDDDQSMVVDLIMMLYTPGGKERTRAEWKKLLEAGGFSRYKFSKLPVPVITSIIEAFPV